LVTVDLVEWVIQVLLTRALSDTGVVLQKWYLEKRRRRARIPENAVNRGNPVHHIWTQIVRRQLESVFFTLIRLKWVERSATKKVVFSHKGVCQRARIRLYEGHLHGQTRLVCKFSLELLRKEGAESDVFVVVIFFVDL